MLSINPSIIKIIVLIPLFSFAVNPVVSQDSLGQVRQESFYPLGTGDVWEYFVDGFMGIREDTTTVSVNGDTVIANKTYKIVTTKSFHLNTTYFSFERVDTTGDIYRFDPSSGGDALLYRFSDTSKTFWIGYGPLLARFDTSYTTDIFSEPRKVFVISYYSGTDTTWRYSTELAEGLGLVSEFTSHMQGSFLQGAIINGIQYGTITSVREGEPKLPDSFVLAQNYPNPFNPETQIRFQLTRTQKITLKVFNTLGQEIRTLIDERKAAGFYSIQWDGTDQNGHRAPSGFYLYQIEAGGSRETKKMLLIR